MAQAHHGCTAAGPRSPAGEDDGPRQPKLLPVADVATIAGRSASDAERWRAAGLEAIAAGKVAVLLLAGGQLIAAAALATGGGGGAVGQGTRLGSADPKGCYDIGLPSHKSLFQLQAERIRRVQALAAPASATPGAPVIIPWYIMTSAFTDQPTRAFFAARSHFALRSDQVVFFQQRALPLEDRCLVDCRVDNNSGSASAWRQWQQMLAHSPQRDAAAACVCLGRLLALLMGMEASMPCESGSNERREGGKVVTNGSNAGGGGDGGAAMKVAGVLDDMQRRGVEYVDCFSVDNALARVADPVFLGHCITAGVPCGAKVVEKAYPEERVGVFVSHGAGGPVAVVEYSELDPKHATAADPATGQLAYRWSNICMHMFSTPFLREMADVLERESKYHVAMKKILSVDGVVDGIKLEQFVFDVFSHAPSMALFEVARNEEFAPVKNAPGAPTDSPVTARRLLLLLHRRWVEAAGGSVLESGASDAGEYPVVVAPLVPDRRGGFTDRLICWRGSQDHLPRCGVPTHVGDSMTPLPQNPSNRNIMCTLRKVFSVSKVGPLFYCTQFENCHCAHKPKTRTQTKYVKLGAVTKPQVARKNEAARPLMSSTSMMPGRRRMLLSCQAQHRTRAEVNREGKARALCLAPSKEHSGIVTGDQK
eukprot:SM000142S00504  [mRNA]  locus=s142:47619:52116:+ [translate_table: standard]